MKKTIQSSIIVAALAMGVTSQAFAFNQLTGQIDLGQSGANVSNLQEFLAASPEIYPQGLVTGYYGSLTKAAVIRFQAAHGLDAVGRVGPQTVALINNLMLTGGLSADDTAPVISSVMKSISSNSATITWNTNENSKSKVFYGTNPVSINEGTVNSIGFGVTGGQTAMNDNIARTTQQVTITGLQPNTNYYYMVVSADLQGNTSVANVNDTFRTNQ